MPEYLVGCPQLDDALLVAMQDDRTPTRSQQREIRRMIRLACRFIQANRTRINYSHPGIVAGVEPLSLSQIEDAEVDVEYRLAAARKERGLE